MLSNVLKVFPSVPCVLVLLYFEKNSSSDNSGHKTAAMIEKMTKPTIVCYYCYSCIDLPLALVDFQVEGFPSLL